MSFPLLPSVKSINTHSSTDILHHLFAMGSKAVPMTHSLPQYLAVLASILQLGQRLRLVPLRVTIGGLVLAPALVLKPPLLLLFRCCVVPSADKVSLCRSMCPKLMSFKPTSHSTSSPRTPKPSILLQAVSSSPSESKSEMNSFPRLIYFSLLQSESDEALEVAVTQVFREYGTVWVKIRRDAKHMPFAFCQYTVSLLSNRFNS